MHFSLLDKTAHPTSAAGHSASQNHLKHLKLGAVLHEHKEEDVQDLVPFYQVCAPLIYSCVFPHKNFVASQRRSCVSSSLSTFIPRCIHFKMNQYQLAQVSILMQLI